MPSLSVASRVLTTLCERLKAIDGSELWHYDMHDRVFARRSAVDAIEAPAIFIARRVGGGEQRTLKPGQHTLVDKTVVYDCIAIVPAEGDDPGLAAEQMLADMERALEQAADLYLRDDELEKNLLSDALQLVDPVLDGFDAPAGVEIAAVGVQCTWPHRYGDPTHVD